MTEHCPSYHAFSGLTEAYPERTIAPASPLEQHSNPRTGSDNCQESNPVCQRQTCPNQGKSYSEASRRVTLEITQKTELPVMLNGLNFSDDRITVDLCVICYHMLTYDKAVQMLSVIGIGPYEGVQHHVPSGASPLVQYSTDGTTSRDTILLLPILYSPQSDEESASCLQLVHLKDCGLSFCNTHTQAQCACCGASVCEKHSRRGLLVVITEARWHDIPDALLCESCASLPYQTRSDLHAFRCLINDSYEEQVW